MNTTIKYLWLIHGHSWPLVTSIALWVLFLGGLGAVDVIFLDLDDGAIAR